MAVMAKYASNSSSMGFQGSEISNYQNHLRTLYLIVQSHVKGPSVGSQQHEHWLSHSLCFRFLMYKCPGIILFSQDFHLQPLMLRGWQHPTFARNSHHNILTNGSHTYTRELLVRTILNADILILTYTEINVIGFNLIDVAAVWKFEH